MYDVMQGVIYGNYSDELLAHPDLNTRFDIDEWWGTVVNPEAKLLLLTHAFEQWQVQRVAICTDARNRRSRSAIERLGATFEGVLRNHRLQAGHESVVGAPRDTACYSIVPDEWPSVRARLGGRP